MTRVLIMSSGRHMKIGFSTQTNLLLPRIQAAGYEVVMFALGEVMGEPHVDKDGILTLGTMDDWYGNDAYPLHMEWTQPDFSLSFVNSWMLNPGTIGKWPHAAMEMVECDPMRPKDLRALRNGPRWHLVPSQFGMRVMTDAGFDPIYSPLGVDTNAFIPGDRQAARERMQARADGHAADRGFDWQLGDKFLAVMVGMNNIVPPRKGFYEGLAAFKIFHDRHPDSVLYIHTRMNAHKGINIINDVNAVKLPEGVLDYPNQYFYANGMIPDAWLNDAYNAADVLLHPSHMEGFGLPIVEAQAAGCPVIVTDYASMPELVFSGCSIPGQKYPAQDGWYWCRPRIEALVDALEEAYQKREDGKRREAARAGALAYDIDKVFAEHMIPTLARITEEAKGHAEWGLATAMKREREIEVNGVRLTVRTQQDEDVAHDVQREYFPDIIDYTKIKRAVDVGAHIGAWTLFVKSQSPDAQIVAIEANPENAALLRQNVNHGTQGVTVLEGMCAYTPGEYDMLIDPNSTGGHTLVKRGADVPRHGDYSIRRAYEGRQYRLFNAFDALRTLTTAAMEPVFDVLKLDCEGGEYDILMNANVRELAAFRYIVGEYHNEMGDIAATLLRLEPWFTVRALRPQADEKFGLFCLERKDR